MVLVCAPASQAGAHRSVALTLHSDGAGSIRATATWEDGHPLDTAVAATLLATTTTGQRVGPVPLTHRGGGTLTYPGTLTAGRWRVAVDVAVPGIGHCEATVDVPGRPAETKCATTVSTTAPTPPPSRRPWAVPVALGAAAVVAAMGAVVAIRLAGSPRRAGRSRKR